MTSTKGYLEFILEQLCIPLKGKALPADAALALVEREKDQNQNGSIQEGEHDTVINLR